MLKLKCLVAQLHLGLYGNFNWRSTVKQTACSNLSCTLVMEEGRQKSRRLSFMSKFKREFNRCAEDKGDRKATAIFGVDESNVRLWRKHKAVCVKCHKRNSLDPRKDDFLKLMTRSSRFFKRDARLECLWVMIYFERRRQKRLDFLTFLEVVLIQMSHTKTLKITPTCFDHQMIIIRELFDPG
jgi:hypothetical protein